MNIEQITREYLSSFFGQDLNECVDSLTEEHIVEAIASINLLAKSLNEQSATVGSREEKNQRRMQATQDEIKAHYAAWKGSGQKPYQPAGGGKEFMPHREYGKQPDVDYEAMTAGNDFMDGIKGGIDKFKTGMTDAIKNFKMPTPYEFAQENPGYREKALDRGVERLRQGMDMTKRGDMTPDEYSDMYTRIVAGDNRLRGYRLNDEQKAKIKQTALKDVEFERETLPYLVKAEVALRAAENRSKTQKLISGRGTVEGERQIDAVLSKPSTQPRAEAARKAAIASRKKMKEQDKASGMDTALGDPETYKFYQDQGVKPTGQTDSGEPAYTAQDRLDYFADKKRFGKSVFAEQALPNTVQRGVQRGLAGDRNLPGQYVDPARGVSDPYQRLDISRNLSAARNQRDTSLANNPAFAEVDTDDPNAVQARADEIMQRVQDRTRRGRSDEQIAADREAARQHQMDTRPRRAVDKFNRDVHSDNVRMELTNRRRAERGLPPLQRDQFYNLKAPKTMANYGDLMQQYAEMSPAERRARDTGTYKPYASAVQQSEEDYLNSVLPGNRTNTTGLSQGTPVNPANPFGPRVSRPGDKPGFRTTGSTPPVM